MTNPNDPKKGAETKKKKKTSVQLPGSLSDLVRDLQNGGTAPAAQSQSVQNDDNLYAKGADAYDAPQQPQDQQYSQPRVAQSQDDGQWRAQQRQAAETQTDRVGETDPYTAQSTPAVKAVETREPAQAPVYANDERAQNRPLGPQPAPRQVPDGRGRPPKQDRMKEYQIVRDDSRDSWELFLDLAKQYRDCGGKLATIYIDGNLKNILDRMKYAGPEKLSTSAILSSIVTRFIYDHEQEIRKTLFENNIF